MSKPSAALVARADEFEKQDGDTLTVLTKNVTRDQWALLRELKRRGWAMNSDERLTQIYRGRLFA